ncbi:MAG: N-methyl-L-tryptophan oxidase [Betaproteobacteria bacterium]|nr:N-methyl-L-tryptophan oxidase [Betaproteobacteria bacterium]
MSTNVETTDVLVIGLGAMGAATTLHLARAGVRVIGIDQFAPPHAMGSTHGETRITRQAIGEGEQFVPLALRSHQLWREIEAETGAQLFNACGGLIMTRGEQMSRLHDQQDFLGNTIRAAERFGIAHQKWRATDIADHYPQFVLHGDEIAYFEPGAGYVAPEACVNAQLKLATRHGATLRLNEKVIAISHHRDHTEVTTDRARYHTDTTIIAAGAWTSQLVPALASTLTVRRQVLHWFQLDGSVSYAPQDMPIFITQWGDAEDAVFYGFPQTANNNVIKVATEQRLADTTADTVDRNTSLAESAAMHARHVAGRLRGVTARAVKSVACLYTNAPNANFIIDRLPDAPNTIVIAACSGHGFKHSAAIGEAVAQMITQRDKPAVLHPFPWPKTSLHAD